MTPVFFPSAIVARGPGPVATNLRTGPYCCENTNLRTGLDQWIRQLMARDHGYNKQSIDPFPDLLHYRLFPCHGGHFGGLISIAFNGVKHRGSYFTKTHEDNKLILHC